MHLIGWFRNCGKHVASVNAALEKVNVGRRGKWDNVLFSRSYFAPEIILKKFDNSMCCFSKYTATSFDRLFFLVDRRLFATAM